MYEREYLTAEGMQGVFAALGVGIAFIMISLFVPDMGIISAGLLTPLTIFFALGCLCLFAVVMELKNQIKRNIEKKSKVMPNESTIIVQAGMNSSGSMIMGGAFFGMGCIFSAVSLFMPEGVLEYGFSSGMIVFLAIGGPFALIGFGLLVFGIPELKTIAIYKKLYKDTMMFTTTGTYFEIPADKIVAEKKAPTRAMGGKLLYKYQDEMGVIRIGETYDRFSETELAWFKEKGSFKVRCKGKYSVILEYPLAMDDPRGMY